MRSLYRGLILATLLGVFLLSGASTAGAIETSNSEFVIIREDDVLEDDLYAAAVGVTVEGVIDGDLVAFAAEEVVIEGSVTGSLWAIAPRVVVNGTVGDSIRVSANTLRVDGSVDGDVVAAAFTVDLGESSEVSGDVLSWAWYMRALGSIENGIRGSARSMELGGSVGADIEASVNHLTVIADLEVGGDLDYRSENEAEGLENAEVGGVVVEQSPLPPNIRVRALTFFGRFLAVLFLTISALTVAWGWPQRTAEAIGDVGSSPLRSWALGALVAFSPLILAGVAALILLLAPAAASFPLLAMFAPLILATVGLVGALSLVAGAPVVGWLGGRLFRRLDLYGSILAGSLIAGMLWFVPILGWLVPLVVLPMGLGAWLLGWRSQPGGHLEGVA